MDSTASANQTRPGRGRAALGGRTMALVLAVGLALAGCSSKPARVADEMPGAKGSAQATAPAPGGGAYYKDDGPHASVPDNLDDIPDAVPRIEPLHPPALRPYTVMGQRFVPRTEITPYRERGQASWYGRRFHGNPTSTGETYDMYAMTAAHPTLPLPSYARVTNLANGRSVIVRVNDRGPFLRGRIIDLSYVAAHRLGYINAGSAHVEVESILPDDIRQARIPGPPVVAAPVETPVALAPLPEPIPPAPALAAAMAPMPPAAATGGVFLQLGAFSTPANAEGLVKRVRTELGLFADRLHLLDDGGRYRLQLGPFASADEARTEAGRIGALLDLQPFLVFR